MIDSLEDASREELEQMLRNMEDVIDELDDRIAELQDERDMYWQQKLDIQVALNRLNT